MGCIITRLAAVLWIIALLAGCSDDGNDINLDRFIEEVMAEPNRAIEPLQLFKPYESFTYSAGGLRSPFEPPSKVEVKQQSNSDLKPDSNREKELLEQFPIESFLMVGTLSDKNGIWGLIKAEGSVYRARIGDYIGFNNGRITSITEASIQLIEIIPSGPENWIERSKTLKLIDLDENENTAEFMY
ncbi:MAG: pilus assembly protein PilP [Endozoicomonadaceae bacterium]|nr:pilus assembly protein PilP [Endozoicomonadaceae bacterium]